jgi:dTDP-L-rhamnose 4-epimerase
LNWDFSVNGGKLTPQKSNENDYIRPLTHYALSKYDQERMVLNFCQTEDISGLATRFYLTYGPRQSLSNPYTGIFSIFSSQILNGCSPVIFEDGNQTRDLIFVDDLIDGLMILLDSKPNDRKIYNIGTGKSQRIIDIAKLLAFKINKNIKIEHSNNFRIGDVRNTMSDISAMNELGFFSKTSLDNGVNKYLDWFYSQKMIKSNFKNAFTKLAKNGIIKISK